MVPRCLRLWLIPVAVWAAALPFAFGQQNGAVFLKDGDHLALAPVTFGASGFTPEAAEAGLRGSCQTGNWGLWSR